MLRQYAPQRFRYAEINGRLREIETLPVGTVFRSTNCASLRTRTLIVDAWLTREIGAGRFINGKYENTYVARGAHLAICRDLSNGERITLADHFIHFAVDHD